MHACLCVSCTAYVEAVYCVSVRCSGTKHCCASVQISNHVHSCVLHMVVRLPSPSPSHSHKQNNIYRIIHEIESLKDQMKWNQQTLDAYLEESARKDEDVLLLQKYSRQDEGKVKELTLRIQNLHENLARNRRALDNERTETVSAQVCRFGRGFTCDVQCYDTTACVHWYMCVVSAVLPLCCQPRFYVHSNIVCHPWLHLGYHMATDLHIEWNLSIVDTTGTQLAVL